MMGLVSLGLAAEDGLKSKHCGEAKARAEQGLVVDRRGQSRCWAGAGWVPCPQQVSAVSASAEV